MQNLLPFLLSFGVLGGWIARRRLRASSARRTAHEERSLWSGLAAGLFDSDECPATSRLEIALAAMARKLGLRAALVTAHGRDRCVVLATAGIDGSLLEGLERGAEIPRASLYCGTLRSPGQSLAIAYASLSEWRRHPAFLERGWESYLAHHCGFEQGEDVVVAFLDSRPRGSVFSASERALLEQLAPWIVSMVSERGAHPVADAAAGELVAARALGSAGES